MRLIVRVILIVTVSCIIILYAVQSFPAVRPSEVVQNDQRSRSKIRLTKLNELHSKIDQVLLSLIKKGGSSLMISINFIFRVHRSRKCRDCETSNC